MSEHRIRLCVTSGFLHELCVPTLFVTRVPMSEHLLVRQKPRLDGFSNFWTLTVSASFAEEVFAAWLRSGLTEKVGLQSHPHLAASGFSVEHVPCDLNHQSPCRCAGRCLLHLAVTEHRFSMTGPAHLLKERHQRLIRMQWTNTGVVT